MSFHPAPVGPLLRRKIGELCFYIELGGLSIYGRA